MIRWPYSWRKKEGIPMRIPHLAGAIYLWDCIMENLFIRLSPLPKKGVWQGDKREEVVTVSLTTFPKRIDACYFAIKSLMIQKYKADRIVLWLAEEQFPDHKLPEKYKKMMDRGLEIRYCDDLRSHKKYYYALQEQEEHELVVTFDDDIIYEYDAISKLMKLHKKYPRYVICNRAHHITQRDGSIEPYRKWKICSREGVGMPSFALMPSTGAGCLYPYGVMPEKTFDKTLIKQNAMTADDLWMFFNRVENNVPAVRTRWKNAILCNVFDSQQEALTKINDLQNENEKTIERLMKVFPEVPQKLLQTLN